MTLPQTTSILIIGAGPTGLMMACQLCRWDIDFVIIDKKWIKLIELHEFSGSRKLYHNWGIKRNSIFLYDPICMWRLGANPVN